MYRTGLGYDIHKLVRNRKFILGGITIPYKKGFLAHSDGDVLIHSMIDALLGAMNAGDIGRHFPDSNPRYKDIASTVLLTKTMQLLKEKNFIIENIDTTVICQKPKLQSFIEIIQNNLSSVMQLDKTRISIKAKTKEKIDSVGKGKAVEVFTIVLIKDLKEKNTDNN